MREKQGILGRISRVSSGEETNSRSTSKRKGSKCGASSKSNKSNNPFEGRGMEKFNEVYSELEAMRAAIAAREGVSTSDVWFTRGTAKGNKDWVPIVVGKPSSRVSSPERVFTDPEEESTTSSRSLESSAAVALGKGVEQTPSWLSLKAEQIIYDLQQGVRRAVKAVTLFVMIVAAVADVLVALVAGFASSFAAKHLRSFWARFLPLSFTQRHLDFEFPVPVSSSLPPPSPVAMFPCSSCPTSPRQQQQQDVESFKASIKSTKSASTPVSPVRPLPTFFNSRGHQAAADSTAKQQQQQRIDRNKHNLIQRESSSSSQQQQQLSDGTPIMLIVLVILFSLSVGRITAALLASMAWFLFPIFKTFAGRTSSSMRITGAAAAHGAFRKQRSFIK